MCERVYIVCEQIPRVSGDRVDVLWGPKSVLPCRGSCSCISYIRREFHIQRSIPYLYCRVKPQIAKPPRACGRWTSFDQRRRWKFDRWPCLIRLDFRSHMRPQRLSVCVCIRMCLSMLCWLMLRMHTFAAFSHAKNSWWHVHPAPSVPFFVERIFRKHLMVAFCIVAHAIDLFVFDRMRACLWASWRNVAYMH
jgi:hypothetical protein